MVYDLFKSKFSIFSFQNVVFCNSFSHIFSKFKCLGPEGGLVKSVYGIPGPFAMLISLLCSSCSFLKKNFVWKIWLNGWEVEKSIKYVRKVWMSQNKEAPTQRCSMKKVFWKHLANLQENTHAEVWFQ